MRWSFIAIIITTRIISGFNYKCFECNDEITDENRGRYRQICIKCTPRIDDCEYNEITILGNIKNAEEQLKNVDPVDESRICTIENMIQKWKDDLEKIESST